MIDELRALKLIKERLGKESQKVTLGIGDDCAAVSFTPGHMVLVTTDTQVEGTHFNNADITPRTLGRKSVAVSVSDIAAMGGVPRYLVISAGFPGNLDEKYLNSIIQGFIDAEAEFDVKVIGGNLSTSKAIFIDVTALGEVSKEYLVERKGATPGDLIFVTGTLGDSSLGFKIIQENPVTDKGKEYLVGRHTTPHPRLSLGKMLADENLATSMIDISDGLMLDLSRISVDYGCGAEIFLEKLPLSEAYVNNSSDYSNNFYDLALSGGEDYDLLFTSEPANIEKIRNLAHKTDISISKIGRITNNPEIVLLDMKGEKIEIENKGYVHFQN